MPIWNPKACTSGPFDTPQLHSAISVSKCISVMCRSFHVIRNFHVQFPCCFPLILMQNWWTLSVTQTYLDLVQHELITPEESKSRNFKRGHNRKDIWITHSSFRSLLQKDKPFLICRALLHSIILIKSG